MWQNLRIKSKEKEKNKYITISVPSPRQIRAIATFDSTEMWALLLSIRAKMRPKKGREKQSCYFTDTVEKMAKNKDSESDRGANGF